jgi:hypothetical protein
MELYTFAATVTMKVHVAQETEPDETSMRESVLGILAGTRTDGAAVTDVDISVAYGGTPRA